MNKNIEESVELINKLTHTKFFLCWAWGNEQGTIMQRCADGSTEGVSPSQLSRMGLAIWCDGYLCGVSNAILT